MTGLGHRGTDSSPKSLKERINEDLKPLLLAEQVQVGQFDDPFAILCYDPKAEFELRTHLMLLRADLAQSTGRRLVLIDLSALMWQIVGHADPLTATFDMERQLGLEMATKDITSLLSDEDAPLQLSELVRQQLLALNPERDIAFLYRAGSLYPVYRTAALLEQLRKSDEDALRVRVPTVLCFPGELDGAAGLRFMNRFAADPNYRARIY